MITILPAVEYGRILCVYFTMSVATRINSYGNNYRRLQLFSKQ